MIKTAVIYIVRKFDMLSTNRTPKKFEQEPKHFMSCQKGGVYLKFSKRR